LVCIVPTLYNSVDRRHGGAGHANLQRFCWSSDWHHHLRPTAVDDDDVWSTTGQGTSVASAYRQDDSLHEQPLLQLPLSSAPATLTPPPPSSSSSSSHQPRSRCHCSENHKIIVVFQFIMFESILLLWYTSRNYTCDDFSCKQKMMSDRNVNTRSSPSRFVIDGTTFIYCIYYS